MAKDRNGTVANKNDDGLAEEGTRKSKAKSREADSDSDSDSQHHRKKALETPDSDSEEEETKRSSKRKRKSRKRPQSRPSYDSESESESESEYSSTEESELASEEERRRRKRKERKRREREEERERKRRKREKEKKRRRKEKEEKKRKKKKEKLERGKKGAVTNSWGEYGIIRETDMWNKRPEFTAWLAEVKQVNLESLPNWEEKQMFKEFMEDHNTATFTSKKYYNLDAYYKHKMEKEQKRGVKSVLKGERTVFNDEEQRRQELLREREKHKEAEVEALKRSMEGGMAQAMKEQAQLKEEMAYQYKIGNFEAAAAIQRRLDPDIAM